MGATRHGLRGATALTLGATLDVAFGATLDVALGATLDVAFGAGISSGTGAGGATARGGLRDALPLADALGAESELESTLPSFNPAKAKSARPTASDAIWGSLGGAAGSA